MVFVASDVAFSTIGSTMRPGDLNTAAARRAAADMLCGCDGTAVLPLAACEGCRAASRCATPRIRDDLYMLVQFVAQLLRQHRRSPPPTEALPSTTTEWLQPAWVCCDALAQCFCHAGDKSVAPSPAGRV